MKRLRGSRSWSCRLETCQKCLKRASHSMNCFWNVRCHGYILPKDQQQYIYPSRSHTLRPVLPSGTMFATTIITLIRVAGLILARSILVDPIVAEWLVACSPVSTHQTHGLSFTAQNPETYLQQRNQGNVSLAIAKRQFGKSLPHQRSTTIAKSMDVGKRLFSAKVKRLLGSRFTTLRTLEEDFRSPLRPNSPCGSSLHHARPNLHALALLTASLRHRRRFASPDIPPRLRTRAKSILQLNIPTKPQPHHYLPRWPKNANMLYARPPFASSRSPRLFRDDFNSL